MNLLQGHIVTGMTGCANQRCSQAFNLGVWVKSRVFGHESESSLKSLNKGSLKKSHSESSCIEIFLFTEYINIWSMICFVKKEVLKCKVILHPACYMFKAVFL